MSPATTPASTRWCPTTEQLMILEEMYKSGVRTPNATQIQHITAHLAYYGKIEGKNVFYWFQNHKARDRQKLRRKLINRQQQHLLRHHQQQQHIYEQPSTTIGIGPGLHQFPHFLHPQHEEAGGEIVLHQEGKQASQVMKKYKWTYDDNTPERLVLVNNHQMMGKSSPSPSSTTTTVNMYDRDWMMMMDVMNPPTTTFQYPCCNSVNSNTYFNNTNDNNRPILKTLELFPVKSTNLKDECCAATTTTTSSKQQHLHFLSSATCSSTTTS